MKPRLLIMCSVAVVCLFAACSGRTGHTFQTHLEEGVPIVETTGGPRYQDPLFTIEEVLRLEQDESRPETLYNNATGFMMGPEGNYFVLDRGTSTILKYARYSKITLPQPITTTRSSNPSMPA